VDIVKRLLLREGAPVPLTPKAFEILVLLLQRRGGVVEKDDILRDIWHGTVVEENNLARNISTLRKVLDDTPGENRFIVTIPGRGYQFVGDVEEAEAPQPNAPPVQVHSVAALDSFPAHRPDAIPLRQVYGGQEGPALQTRVRLLAVALVLITFAAVGYAIRASRRPVGDASSPPQQIWQLTFASGLQGEPSWSPDGRSK
jgi:DNA-binding winged helix-turn-helix (wHTH) protein